MKNYLDLLNYVMDAGVDIKNSRTGVVCRTTTAPDQLKFDLRLGLPVVTTRKLPIKNIIGELIGFFRGYTSAKDFRSVGCKFWDANANETEAWLNNPFRKGEDDLGPIYGKQWTSWLSEIMIGSVDDPKHLDKIKYLMDLGYFISSGKQHAFAVKEINQLEELVANIIKDPTNRRLIVSGYNLADFPLMALPPCHVDYRFICYPKKHGETEPTIDLVVTIRSWDLFLGAPANILSSAIFLSIVGKMTGHTPRTLVMQSANAHIYETHFDAVTKQLERYETLVCNNTVPYLYLGDSVKKIECLDDVRNCFYNIKPEDIVINDYNPLPAIYAPMAA